MEGFVSYQCLVKIINDDNILKHILVNYFSIFYRKYCYEKIKLMDNYSKNIEKYFKVLSINKNILIF